MRDFSGKIQRLVIKVGSSSITHENGKINLKFIDGLAWELAKLRNEGIKVVLVSSGSIAAGAKSLNLPERPRDTIGKQAASAVGQVTLMQLYHRAFSTYGYQAAQVLLTRQIELDPLMKDNGKNTFEKLLEMDVIPVVNENDAISTFEIEFGDNDTLSAIVARIIGADMLIMLTDIDGLYEDDPRQNPQAKQIFQVDEISKQIRGMAKGAGSQVGTGGMATKINAADLATLRGINVVVANGNNLANIQKIVGGEEIGTYFLPRIGRYR